MENTLSKVLQSTTKKERLLSQPTFGTHRKGSHNMPLACSTFDTKKKKNLYKRSNTSKIEKIPKRCSPKTL
jgi:hypothetical protein